MKNICRLIICFLFLFGACRKESSSNNEADLESLDSNAISEVIHLTPTVDPLENRDSIATYEFVYPYNTEDLIENHYIKLNFGNEPLTGKYYGTTDEFDQAREEYLPGFFVTDLFDLQIQGDSIKFVLLCSDDDFFTKPIDLRIKNSDEAKKQGYTKWDVRLRTNMKKYKGSIHGDTIHIKNELGDRFYLRVE
ncbi:MAG: hypothetical protein O9262_03235 [Cyclobacteriaceae bacterium]|nr:hypothetical protein [Cyclobacteriaceae bacterium]